MIVRTSAAEAEQPVDAATEHPWRVLHTKSRQEKVVAEVLEARGRHVYLPLVHRVAYHGNRRRTVETPLFSSYLFLRGPLEAVYFAISTKRVVQAIEVTDQQRLDTELKQIQRALGAGALLEPFAGRLVRGRRARVRSGPFRGVEGLIEGRGRRSQLVLEVHTLGRATSLEIDVSLLDPLD